MSHRWMVRRLITALVVVASTAACRGLVGVPSGTDAPVAARRSLPPRVPLARWPIKTSAHIELWLHAFAMLTDDSTAVPEFRRGYRDSVTVKKNRANVLTSLDAHRQALSKGVRSTPSYSQAQSLAFEFDTWDALRVELERFVQADGDSHRVVDRAPVTHIVQLTRLFPTTADREWLRLFVTCVQDEQARFFDAEHAGSVRSRHATITAVDSLWQKVYRSRFDRFMTNTGQQTGDVVLVSSIGGVGRSGRGSERQSVLAVPFPSRTDDARDVILVLAHELAGPLTSRVVLGTAPSERRNTLLNRQLILPQVHAGALLLERIAPELLEPYMRFYLQQSGTSGTASRDVFDRAFAIPTAQRDELRRAVALAAGAN